MKVGKRDEPFDWDALVPPIVSPTKVTIIEALLRIGTPLSAGEITRLVDDPDVNLSRVSYHLESLAKDDVLTTVRMRGTERLYVVAARG